MTGPALRPATGRRSVVRRLRVAAVGLLLATTGAGATAGTGARAYAGPGAPADDPVLFTDDGTAPTIDQLPDVVLVAHRAGGLEARENSLSGIEHALDSGVVDVVDLDLRQLADGTLGIMHDRTVDRATSSTGRTSAYTRSEWEALRLDLGSWLVPQPPPEAPTTLAEVLERHGDRTVFTVEVKEGLVDEVARLIRSQGRTDSVFVSTNDPDVARRVHEEGLRSSLWRNRSQMRTDRPRTFRSYVDLLDVDVRAARKHVTKFVRSGVPRVWVHPVTTRAERDRALRLGATGVISDAPRYVAGVTDIYPASTTVLELRGRARQVQVSDRTRASVAVSSESGPVLPQAVVQTRSRQLSGRTVATSARAVTTVELDAARAVRGRTKVTLVVRAGRSGERRWPAAASALRLRVRGEDLRLAPRLELDGRRLQVDVRTLDSAARAYRGPRRETGAARTPADLDRAGLRLRVLRRGDVVHREREPGDDTGAVGDGAGRVSFGTWKARHRGWYTVRVVQRGQVYRHVVAERRVRLG